MKKGFIVLFVLLGLAFLAIAYMKNRPADPTGPEPAVPSRVTDSTRTQIIDFWKYYDRATDLRTAGAYDEARKLYRKSLSIDPDHQNALYYLGNLQLRSGAFGKAERSWKHLARVNPGSARAYSRLGTLYSCRDSANSLYDMTRAADHFAEAARLNREETGPLLQLAKIDLVNRRYGQAEQKLEDVISSNFRSAEALFLRGYIAWRRGRLDDAASYLSRASGIVQGTSEEKNVGEGDTRDGSAAPASGSSRCSLYTNSIFSLLQEGDPDTPDTGAIYRNFESAAE